MSQDVNLRLGPEELGAVTTTSSALMETVHSRDGDRGHVLKDGPVKSAAPPLGSGTKRSRDAASDHPENKPLKHPRMEAGPSTIKATGVPQFVPDSQEELLVLPPMPKSLFEELTTFHGDLDSSVTEPESSEDEARARGYIPSK